MIKGNLISWLLLDEGQYDNIKLDDNNAISLHQIFKIIHLISHRGSFNSQRNCDNVTMVVNPTVGLSDKPASGHNQYTVEVGIFTIRPFLPMKKEKRTCEIFLSPVSFSFSTWERVHTKIWRALLLPSYVFITRKFLSVISQSRCLFFEEGRKNLPILLREGIVRRRKCGAGFKHFQHIELFFLFET